ncbi:F-box/kelch-repeat protein At1g57790-like [Papaver somniferum]|uniref:F-box/kelch-repeat protein At1g57790-like n=1 Tax=Papaver somniferum TaxID=3469 RepID=UPI000E6FAE3D|nr:F-box/kelch-repeat protein At1g57790-like [Papaver somniferum]
MGKAVKSKEYRVYVAADDKIEYTGEVNWCVFRLISDYLHPVDYLHSRAVSKMYLPLINLRRSLSSSTRTLETADASPWLVSPDCDQTVYKFVNPMYNNESYLMNISESFEGFRIRFSKGGWLLMSKDCVVFGICQRVGSETSDIFTFFSKRGDDRWINDSFPSSYLPPDGKMMKFEVDFNNPVFYRGAFYCLDNNGTLGVSTIEHSSSWEILATVTRPKCECIYKTFLVECEGKLLSVLLGHLGKWVRVFRLNDADMVWVEVKHLGRHMLFISNTSCISAIAPTGQMENKIYFPRLHNEGILYFSLETSIFHCVGSRHSAKDCRDSKEKLNCSWIEPNWSEMSDEYRNWYDI